MTVPFNHELVATRRTELGLSQRKLAKLTGVSYAVILRMERGADQRDLPLRTLAALASTLGLKAGQLLGEGPEGRPDHGRGPSLDGELDVASARLLRQIQRGTDVRKTLASTERATTLPSLAKRGLVDVRGVPHLTHPALVELGYADARDTGDLARDRAAGSGNGPSTEADAMDAPAGDVRHEGP